MAKIDFSEILSKQVGSAPEPKAIPEGTYFGEIVGVPTLRAQQTKEGEKAIATVTIALNEPGDDVDTDSLSEAGGLMLSNGEPKRVRKDFWLAEDSLYQLDRFLKSMGVEGNYQEAFEQLPGREVIAYVTLDEYQTKSGDSRSVNNVSRLFAKE